MAYSVALVVGLKMASNFLKAKQSSDEYKIMAEQELQNARLLRENAYLTRLRGARNEDVSRMKNRAFIASNSAIASEAGMGESPTTMTNLAWSMSMLEQNVLNDRFLTESEAENYLYKARVSEENAKALKKKGNNIFVSSLLNSSADIF